MTGSLGPIHVPEQVACAIVGVLWYLGHGRAHNCGWPMLFWNKSWIPGRIPGYPPAMLDTDVQIPESQSFFFFAFSACSSFDSSFSFGDLIGFFPWNMILRTQATCSPLCWVPSFPVRPSLNEEDHEHLNLCYIGLHFRYFLLTVLFYIFMCKTAAVSIFPRIPSQNSWGDHLNITQCLLLFYLNQWP